MWRRDDRHLDFAIRKILSIVGSSTESSRLDAYSLWLAQGSFVLATCGDRNPMAGDDAERLDVFEFDPQIPHYPAELRAPF